MATYVEHPSKVSRWEDGRFFVLEDAQNEDCTVWFSFERAEDGEERWEGLLARRLAPNRARLSAIPVFVYDVNLGDEVLLLESAERAQVATELVRDAGNYTFRVYFPDQAEPEPDQRWQQLMVELEAFGCWFDVYSPVLIALSAPPGQAKGVADYLVERERRDELRYETGRTHDPN